MTGSTCAEPLTLPAGAFVAGALLLAGPIEPGTALRRLAAPDLRALDRHRLIDQGRLFPWFAAMVEVIAWPDLVAEVVRQEPHGPPQRTIVWARPDAAVLGALVDDAVTIEAIEVHDLGDHLLAACAVDDPGDGDTRPPADPTLVAELLAALLADDAPRVAAVLDRAWTTGNSDAAFLTTATTTVTPTAWSLSTTWTDDGGPAGGTLVGLDAGALGTWEIRGSSHPLDLRATDAHAVRRRLADLLPVGVADRLGDPDPPTTGGPRMTVAADPVALRRVPPAANELGDRVGRAAGEVADALARVQATCVDHRPIVGPVDHELRALVAHWRATGDATARFATELDAADSGAWLGELLELATSVGTDIVDAIRMHPELAERILDLLDDPTPDEIDAAFDALRRAADGVGNVDAMGTFALDLGRLLATSGMPESVLARWAMRGHGAALGRWAKLGLAYTLVDDSQSLYDAFVNHRSGAHKVSVLSQTAFDATSLACQVAPSPYTCGAAVVTGVVWGAAEIYEHREGIGQAIGVGTQIVRSEARQFREAVEQRVGEGVDLADDLVDALVDPGTPYRPIVPLVPPGLAPLVEQGRAIGSKVFDTGRSVAAGGAEFARDKYEQGKEAVVDGGRAVGRKVVDGAGNVGRSIGGGISKVVPGL